MRKLIYISLFVISFVSCENREPENPEIPSWLLPRLTELSDSTSCEGCTLQRSTFNSLYYYDLYCNTSSCVYCEVYDYRGDLVEWGEDFPLSDWLENRTKVIILWECGDEL